MYLKKFPIWVQLLIIALFNIIVLMSLFFIVYSQMAQITLQKNARYTVQLITQLQESISSDYHEIGNMLFNLGYDATIQDYMMEPDPLAAYLKSEKVCSVLSTNSSIKSEIYDIISDSRNGNYQTLKGGILYARSLEPSIAGRGEISCSGFTSGLYADKTKFYLLFGLNVPSRDEENLYGEQIGSVVAVVDLTNLSKKISRYPELLGAQVYLLDRTGKALPLSSSAKENKNLESLASIRQKQLEPVIKTVNGTRSIIQVCDLPEIGGKVISVLPEKELLSDLSMARAKAMIILIIALPLLLLTFLAITRNILLPLRKLANFMDNIKQGNLTRRIELFGYAEISRIACQFNSMLNEINTLTTRLIKTNTQLYQAELSKKESQIAFLQSQINPHFLFNTFECIKGIASAKGVSEIREMMDDLSRIFSYSVREPDEVLLEQEFGILKAYIHINVIRFGDRFSVRYEISEASSHCKVPKMILQPIVENAIFHGLEPLDRKGTLYIVSYVEKALTIVIEDDGVGFDPKALACGQAELTDDGMGDFHHSNRIGIVNIDNRLKLKYGEAYGLSVFSRPGEGTRVVLKLPVRRG